MHIECVISILIPPKLHYGGGERTYSHFLLLRLISCTCTHTRTQIKTRTELWITDIRSNAVVSTECLLVLAAFIINTLRELR